MRDNQIMSTANVKSDLIEIANRLPESASYADAVRVLTVLHSARSFPETGPPGSVD